MGIQQGRRKQNRIGMAKLSAEDATVEAPKVRGGVSPYPLGENLGRSIVPS